MKYPLLTIMRKTFITLIPILLFGWYSNTLASDCPVIGNGFIDGRVFKLAVVPADKYPSYKINMDDNKCPQPKTVYIPKAVIIIDDILKQNKPVALYVAGRHDDGGGLLEAKWEGLFLSIFGSNKNFTIVERYKLKDIFKETSLTQTGVMAKDESDKKLKFKAATHELIVNGLRSQNGMFKTDY